MLSRRISYNNYSALPLAGLVRCTLFLIEIGLFGHFKTGLLKSFQIKPRVVFDDMFLQSRTK